MSTNLAATTIITHSDTYEQFINLHDYVKCNQCFIFTVIQKMLNIPECHITQIKSSRLIVDAFDHTDSLIMRLQLCLPVVPTMGSHSGNTTDLLCAHGPDSAEDIVDSPLKKITHKRRRSMWQSNVPRKFHKKVSWRGVHSKHNQIAVKDLNIYDDKQRYHQYDFGKKEDKQSDFVFGDVEQVQPNSTILDICKDDTHYDTACQLSFPNYELDLDSSNLVGDDGQYTKSGQTTMDTQQYHINDVTHDCPIFPDYEPGPLVEGDCPACGKRLKADYSTRVDDTFYHQCFHCGVTLELYDDSTHPSSEFTMSIKDMPINRPFFLPVPDANVEELNGLINDAVCLRCSGNRSSGLFANADDVLAMFSKSNEVTDYDDEHWMYFHPVGYSLKQMFPHWHCDRISIYCCYTLGVWAVGISNKKKNRADAGKIALAASIAALAIVHKKALPKEMYKYPAFVEYIREIQQIRQ